MHQYLTKINMVVKKLWETRAQILIMILVASLFFPIRKVFVNDFSFVLGQYTDFTTASLYLSDILLFLILIEGLFSKWFKLRFSKYSYIALILISGLFISNFESFQFIKLFGFLKLIELVLVFEVTKQYLSKYGLKNMKIFVLFFLFLAYLQGILAIFQFSYNSSLGLHVVGESLLSPFILGVAKVVAHGTTKIRGYGTFPHPNLLSVYLITSIFASLSLYFLINKRVFAKVNLIGLSLLSFSLVLTFSRAAALALILGFILFTILVITKDRLKKTLNKPILSIFTGLSLAILILAPYISSRTNLIEQAGSSRSMYNKIGLYMIESDIFYGTGFGNSLIHMQQFSNKLLESWQIQPIHNYFLLATAEGGIIFGFFLLFVILLTFVRLIRSTWNTSSHNNPHDFYIKAGLVSILLSFLTVMQFDHYFYTLQQTQFLLWIIIGASVWQINKKGLS